MKKFNAAGASKKYPQANPKMKSITDPTTTGKMVFLSPLVIPGRTNKIIW